MIIFSKNKKILGGIMIFIFSFSGLFFNLNITKVYATGSITFDPTNWFTNAEGVATTYEQYIKDFVLDALAWELANQMISKISDKIVNWINNGFENPDGGSSPFYPDDFGDIFATAADNASAVFFEKLETSSGLDMCGDIKAQLKSTLAYQYAESFETKNACTLTNVIDNIDNFSDSFENGSWDAWIELTTNPSNTYVGAYLASLEELESRKSSAVESSKTETSSNNGYLSFKTCAEGQAFTDSTTGKEACKKYQVQTPGSAIQGRLNEVMGGDLKKLHVADEIDEIVGALITQMLSKIFETGSDGMRGWSEDSYNEVSGTLNSNAAKKFMEAYYKVQAVYTYVTSSGDDTGNLFESLLKQTTCYWNNAGYAVRDLIKCATDKGKDDPNSKWLGEIVDYYSDKSEIINSLSEARDAWADYETFINEVTTLYDEMGGENSDILSAAQTALSENDMTYLEQYDITNEDITAWTKKASEVESALKEYKDNRDSAKATKEKYYGEAKDCNEGAPPTQMSCEDL